MLQGRGAKSFIEMNLLKETLKARGVWEDVFQDLKDSIANSRILYIAELSYVSSRENSFYNKKQIKEIWDN